MTKSNSEETPYHVPDAAATTPPYERLIAGRLLARNTVLNLIGQAGPLAHRNHCTTDSNQGTRHRSIWRLDPCLAGDRLF